MATKTSTQEISNLVINKVASEAAYQDMISNGQINENELYFVEGDTIITYTISKNGGTITLTGSDESTSSVTITASDIGASASSHTHGNLTNDGKIGSTSGYSVYTTTGGAITAGSLSTSDPAASGTSTSFIATASQDAKGKMTLSKASLPTASTSVAGITTVGASGGAAAYSHGTHVSYSTTAPAMDGTAAVGTASTVARSDHVHPTDTSRAPTSHASSSNTYGVGTASNYGHLKLSDATTSTSGTSDGIAATPSAVKAVKDLIPTATSDLTNDSGFITSTGAPVQSVNSKTGAVSLTYSDVSAAPTSHAVNASTYGLGSSSVYGHVKLSTSTSSTSGASDGIAATPSAVKAAYDLANSKQDSITLVYSTLAAASWSDGSQTISVTGLGASQNAMIGVADTSSAAQDRAAAKAKLKVTAQAAGTVTIVANGTVPTIDIPVALMLL